MDTSEVRTSTPYLSRRPPVIWLTCMDGRDHAAKSMIGTTGYYETACGTQVLPAASQDPPNPPCPACNHFIKEWHHERRFTKRAAPKPSIFRRWFRRCPR